jgi:hypothetical protein
MKREWSSTFWFSRSVTVGLLCASPQTVACGSEITPGHLGDVASTAAGAQFAMNKSSLVLFSGEPAEPHALAKDGVSANGGTRFKIFPEKANNGAVVVDPFELTLPAAQSIHKRLLKKNEFGYNSNPSAASARRVGVISSYRANPIARSLWAA